MKTVTVFGLGFVGLTTALGFSEMGNRVYGIDVDEKRLEIIRSGGLPFAEPSMGDILKKHINKDFTVSSDVKEAVKNSDCIFYCVGTPYGKDGSANLTYLFSAIDSTIAALTDDSGQPIDSRFRVIVTKSTIPPSTTSEKIVPYVKTKGIVAKNIGIANNPEFLREGHCWDDFINPDRIVIGSEDERTKECMRQLYETMDAPIFFVSHSTAEFIKYLSNTLLATLISYSNEMANVADTIGGIDVASAFKILHMDKRWGGCGMTSYVYPGCGYGGYCLPKDTCALLEQSKMKGFEPTVLREVISTNNNRPGIMAEKIAKGLDKSKTIGFLGLSFKPFSDDVRDTPAAKIITELRKRGYTEIIGFDPIANDEFMIRYPDLLSETKKTSKELYDCSDIVVIATAWPEFKEIIKLGNKRIVDCRYML